MSHGIFICHSRSETEWVRALVKYLKASSRVSPSFRCSYLPGFALNREDTEASELKYEVRHAEVVLAVVTRSSLLDAQFVLELATAWAYDRWIIPLMEKHLSEHDLPRALRELRLVYVDGADSLIEVAKSVCHELVESDASHRALDLLLEKEGLLEAGNPPAGVSGQRGEATASDSTLAQQAALLGSAYPLESTPPESLPARRFPSAVESLNAGMALSDCYFNLRRGEGLSDKLDGTFGSFLDALGGSWDEIRVLEDLDVFSGITENLISTLPPARSDIVYWYNLGACISTMLNIAGGDTRPSRRKKEAVGVRWSRSLDKFNQLAIELNIKQREVERISGMLKNLFGPESEKDYSNMTRCLERIRNHAVAYDQDQA